VGGHEIRLDGGGTEPADEYTFFYGRWIKKVFFVRKRIMSLVKRVQFVSDRMSQYIILRDRWCDIIIPNVHGPTEDKIGDMKDRFYEELEHVFDNIPKHHMKLC
jgi:hypothetical protein